MRSGLRTHALTLDYMPGNGSASEMTQLLVELRDGGLDYGRSAPSQRLLEVLYGELRAVAGAMFRGQRPEHTLQPTALVHEAWLRIVDRTSLDVRDQSHFMALAATVMRQVLVDHARARLADKRGGDRQRISFDAALEVPARSGDGASQDPADVVALDDALRALGAVDERQSRVVEMRVFAGMTVDEVAEALGVSPRTVELDWRMARAWLSRAILGDSPSA